MRVERWGVVFSSVQTVELVAANATDLMVAWAARISTSQGMRDSSAEKDAGLINYLMKNRHGTPFEHNSFTFRVHAPIFVMREFMRHRIGFSYNEESGRYSKLEPEFYVPDPGRPLVQEGKAGAYTFTEGTEAQHDLMTMRFQNVCAEAYHSYEDMLQHGIAREVARMVLPLNIFTSVYVTCNARSLMSFLSLRTRSEGSTYPSFPQAEIEVVAREMETWWREDMPVTAEAFDRNGRVAP